MLYKFIIITPIFEETLVYRNWLKNFKNCDVNAKEQDILFLSFKLGVALILAIHLNCCKAITNSDTSWYECDHKCEHNAEVSYY